MTNREWLLNKMKNMSDEEFAELINKGIDIDTIIPCNPHCDYSIDCENCTINWLKSEHKEIPKLSDAERVILENIDKEYKWISRQYTGSIIVWECKPLKSDKAWLFSGGDGNTLLAFNHLFQFIKWEDAEPYNIEELLKGE